MERNLNEVDSCDLEEKALVAVEPCLNKEVPTEYYVYGLDTNDGRIAAAWLCPNEQTAERAYQEAMRQMDSEHLTGQFQFGYIGVDSCAAIEYTHGGFRKVGFFKQKDFTFAASLTKKPVLLAKEHHCIANDLSDFMRRAGMILEELAATDRSKEPVLELDTPAASQQIETAKECFALVFDSSSCDPLRPIDDAMILHETEAVIAIGKLTEEQYRRLPGEFDKRYTGAKRVVFTIEGGWGAHLIPDIPKDMLCCLTECPLSEYLREQNDLQREMLAVLNEIKEQDRKHYEEVRVLREDVTVLKECLQQPIPIYRVPKPNPVTQEDVDEILDGIDIADKRWIPQDKYANAIGCKVPTLQKGRETKNGVIFSSKNSRMGMDKAGNIFLKPKKSGKTPTLYLLRD